MVSSRHRKRLDLADAPQPSRRTVPAPLADDVPNSPGKCPLMLARFRIADRRRLERMAGLIRKPTSLCRLSREGPRLSLLYERRTTMLDVWARSAATTSTEFFAGLAGKFPRGTGKIVTLADIPNRAAPHSRWCSDFAGGFFGGGSFAGGGAARAGCAVEGRRGAPGTRAQACGVGAICVCCTGCAT